MISKKLRNTLAWALAIGTVLLAAYAVLGFHYAPRWARAQAIAWVRDTWHRELALGEVQVNPFRLQVVIRDASLPDADGKPMLGFSRLLVNFEVSSLWHRAWVFSAVQLDTPSVHLVTRADGQLNLADLQSASAMPDATEKSAPLPRLWVQSFAVTQGSAEYTQIAGRSQPLTKRAGPINFSLRDFRTTGEGGGFALTARTSAQEELVWRGRFAVAPQLASQGEIWVSKLQLAGLAQLLPETLPATLSSGQVDIRAQYQLQLADVLTLKVQVPELVVSGLGVRPRGGEADWISIPTLRLEQLDFDLDSRSVHAQSLALEGLKATAWLDREHGLNLSQLWSVAAAAEPAPPANSTALVAAAPWRVDVTRIDVHSAMVDFEDRTVAGGKFKVLPLDLTLRNASTDLSRALPVSLDARINDNAQLKVSGTLTPAPLAAQLDITLQDARVRLLQPYILPVADLSILSGTIGADGRLTVAPGVGGAGPAIRFEGGAHVDQLHTVDNTLQEDLLNLRRLEIQKLRYSSAPAGLQIGRVLVQAPYARIVISPEQILNVSAVFDPQGAARQRAEWRAGQAGPVPARESRAQRVERERAGSEQHKVQVKARADAVARPEDLDTFPVRIGEIRVRAGRMNFSDLSIRPNFSAEIRDLGGAMTALSSARTSHAILDLKGNLGEFSPVTIDGTVQPFAFDQFTDIGMKFENIALPVFNPYSGVFAGYNIAKGALTTELHYKIDKRQLNAAHHIRIDQLEWGEASEFKGEATLPVKFATALLRDRHGVINLDVPVTGSLDDPRLRIGPLLWQVVKNIVVKAATAPFALLGSLFAGAEEAQFVDFRPGDATLDAATSERLAVLAKALVEKPDISLDVPLASVPELDRPALAEQRFRQLLEAAATMARDDGNTAVAAPGYVAASPHQKRAALTAWLRAQKRELPEIPAPSASPAGASRAEAAALADQAAVNVLERALRAGIKVADGELEQLAQARAAAIQTALLREGQLDATRVFVVRDAHAREQDGNLRLQLQLK